jgi:flagellar biosynthetic protein FlhB
MDESRTHEPSKRRRLEARERGQAAHSPELTASAGFLGASVALAFWGNDLVASLVALVRRPFVDGPAISLDAAELVQRIRTEALCVAEPLGVILFAFAATSLLAHQAQVRGLFAPVRLAPDLTRLWAIGNGMGIGSRSSRGLWSLAKAAMVVAIVGWVIYVDALGLQRLGGLNASQIALAAGGAVRRLMFILGVGTLVLGVVDFWLQHKHFEAMLRLTPDEHREELRAMEGDPALRARRRRIAQSWRSDTPEVLAGASLVLTGNAGLTVILAGGPPPRPVSVRSIVIGPAGNRLRESSALARLRVINAPELARQLAQRRPPSLRPTPELLAELAPLWNAG